MQWDTVGSPVSPAPTAMPDLHLAYTLTRVYLNHNRTQYFRPANFWQYNHALEL